VEFAVALMGDVVELVGVVPPSTAEQVAAISTYYRIERTRFVSHRYLFSRPCTATPKSPFIDVDLPVTC
jgi:hypothetical protein